MWACLCNRMEMGRHLVAYCRDAMMAVDNAKHLPLVVVYEAGRYEFARHLLDDFCQLSGTPQCEDSAIWVLTGGKYDAQQLEAAPFSIRNPSSHRCIEKQKSADNPNLGLFAEQRAKSPFKRASFSAGDRRSNYVPQSLHLDMPMDVEFGSAERLNNQFLCHPEGKKRM